MNATDTYHIALVEDHLETRQRLVNIINDHPQLSVIWQATNVAEAVEQLDQQSLSQQRYDVLLVDLGLPDGSGIEVINRAITKQKDADIMVVTVFGDSRNVISAIEAGASGYLLKDGNNDYIADAILQLINGGSPISPSIARHILSRFKDQQPAEPAQTEDEDNNELPKLTPREKDVLNLIAKGFRYEEIANTLNISYHTVTSHIKQIYRKLAVNSRGEAVFEATRLGLVR